ncbi:hypothetical protein V6N12_035983 [Hibiscus sabdariffa]|uniref:Uncharacterized protein n=1 Tax=Hibiscus sabdariffa TaxID=183260 RepID=A0ABR2EPA9_9ROSI
MEWACWRRYLGLPTMLAGVEDCCNLGGGLRRQSVIVIHKGAGIRSKRFASAIRCASPVASLASRLRRAF